MSVVSVFVFVLCLLYVSVVLSVVSIPVFVAVCVCHRGGKCIVQYDEKTLSTAIGAIKAHA